MKKVIVAHPFRQHSFWLASALKKENNLFAYCTTVYDKDKSLMGIVKLLLKGELLKKANGRKCSALDDSEIYLFCEVLGYLALIINRYSKNIDFTRSYQRYLYKCFGKKVAKFAVKNKVDAVIMFDTTATSCFSYIKKYAPDIECILDMAAISRPYAKKIYEEEDFRLKQSYFKKTQSYLWDDRVMQTMNIEIFLADRFIAASQFTANSVIYCGREASEIDVVPYGIDTDKFYISKSEEQHQELKMLFVGHIDYQKGVHYLLEAVKRFPPDVLSLDLYGVYNDSSALYKNGNALNNVHFHGFVTPDQLNKIYNSADVFVFPSTNDGYGFVVLEAMACGCPVLVSNNTGACDLVNEGVCGFKFDSGDIDRIAELIRWCIDNKEKLPEMGLKARETVLSYTWDKYRDSVNLFINN